MEAIIDKIYQLLTVYGLKVIAALAIFIIGRWVAKGVRKLIERIMTRSKVDSTLVSFTANLAYIGLLAFIVIAALGQLGIQTTSFIAILGAAGLAIGLALQGSLSNFAAGFLLIIFRPFKVGDLIEGAGVFGVVEAIQIFTTQLKTADNKTVIVPNAKLTDDNIVNWTVKGTRRVDMVFGIGYEDDIDKARSLIADAVAQDSRILKDPETQIAVSELADSSVNFVVRPWVKVADYWGVYFDLTEKIKKSFDANGVCIPFPQRDVHVYQHASAED
ncbi:mechanosensitive ion channel family protein [Desulfosarcina ovata]|uniref:Mechanosensitive ion channel protein n=2 Tax=Desulfosarcina ovata TaxID=83564 RepID=A0A5K8A5Z4_9BACT|nr:mechanosensitive ion channel domain-containing protein [Desulfosarcina ovata]BBO80608.1 mechanosensitive ion channel protein [Desulfosarcina ovata subsp. sediminis]BBO87818.1 mechanosensitive ion channel protein [Desulfosarcina ovata subsp. ovata]